MTAAQLAREFARLKDAQRLLRFCERECGAPGPSSVRLDVIEQMRILARLIAIHVVPLCLLLALLPSGAWAQHQHPSEMIYGATGRFYETWERPDQPGSSCCNRHDCDTAIDVKQIDGRWWARKKNGGPLMSIPAEKVEQRRDSPDGQSHLCAIGSTVLCFVAGAGG